MKGGRANPKDTFCKFDIGIVNRQEHQAKETSNWHWECLTVNWCLARTFRCGW